jgi:hypothetical protein
MVFLNPGRTGYRYRHDPMSSKSSDSEIIGWREWVSLPDLDIRHLKCKVDTGARTSALHAYFVEPDTARKQIRFGIHPIQRRDDVKLICTSNYSDIREVTDSGGHREMRYFIETSLCLGGNTRPIEISLTNRDTMTFRMLLGRKGMPRNTLVDPKASFLTGKPDFATLAGHIKEDQSK